jgi:origin recognition complex subunit 4
MRNISEWVELAKQCLGVDVCGELSGDAAMAWSLVWKKSVENFLADKAVKNSLSETIGLTRDVRVLTRILVSYTRIFAFSYA